MNWLYLIGLIISLAVFIYLIIALIKPEYFS
jgi:K+-transporting ATPase KdpF subunit